MSRYNMYWMSLEGSEIGVVCDEDRLAALNSGFRQLGFKDVSEYSHYYPGRIRELLLATNALISKSNDKIIVDADDDSIKKYYSIGFGNINGNKDSVACNIDTIGALYAERINNIYIFPKINVVRNIVSSYGVFLTDAYYVFCSDWEG